MSSSFKLTNVVAGTQPVPFSGVLNTRLYSIKCEGLTCFTHLHNRDVSLFGNFFYFILFCPSNCDQEIFLSGCTWHPSLAGELETLHLKGSVFCDKRLKPSVRVPAWKALSPNLFRSLPPCAADSRTNNAHLHYLISVW